MRIVHPAQSPGCEPSQQNTINGPADGADAEHPRRFEQGDILMLDGGGAGDRENHHAHPIVEQALAGDAGFERARYTDRAQNGNHRYWVGRADQRAKNKTPGKRQVDTEQPTE